MGDSCDPSASPKHEPSSFPRTEFSEDQLDRIKSLIKFHFDIEILHKQYESRFLYWELDRRKAFLEDLKQLLYYDRLLQQSFNIGDLVKSSNQPVLELAALSNPLTTQSAPTTPMETMPRSSSRLNIMHSGTPGRNKISPDQCFQYERRSDGVIVKLICPECGRDTFGNVLGVTNHCRIVHGLQFFTSEERMAKCGIPLTEEQALLEIPKIYYDANLRNIYSILSPSAVPTGSDALDLGSPFQGQVESGAVPSLGVTTESRYYVKKSIHITDFSIRTSRPIEQTAITEKRFKEEEPHDDEDFEPEDSDDLDTDFSSPGGIRRRQRRRWTPKPAPKSKKPHIPTESDFPFVWQLVISGPPESHDIRSFVHKARFVLHPTHAPKHLIEVTKPPFVIRTGAYGESIVKINLYLKYLVDESPEQETNGSSTSAPAFFFRKVSFFHPIKNLSLTAKPQIPGTTPTWGKGNETVHKVELEKESSRNQNLGKFDQNNSKIKLEVPSEDLPRVRYLTLKDLSDDDREDLRKSLGVESSESDIDDNHKANLNKFDSRNRAEKEHSDFTKVKDSSKTEESTLKEVNQLFSSLEPKSNVPLAISSSNAYYIPKRTNLKQYIAKKSSRSDGLDSPSSVLPASFGKNIPSVSHSSSQLPEFEYVFRRSGSLTSSFYSSSSLLSSSPIFSSSNPIDFQMDRLLNRFVLYYPLIISTHLDPSSTWSEAELIFVPKATYSPSTNISSFLTLNGSKRLSREWQRAKLVKNLISLVSVLEESVPDNISEKHENGFPVTGLSGKLKYSDKLNIPVPSTLSILLWCRQNRFTPLPDLDPDLIEKSILASEAMWRANYTPIVTIFSKVPINVEESAISDRVDSVSHQSPLHLKSTKLAPLSSMETSPKDPTADEEASLIQGMEVLGDLDNNFISSLFFCRYCGKVQFDKCGVDTDKKRKEKQRIMSLQEKYQQLIDISWMAHGRKCTSKPIRGKLRSTISEEQEDMDRMKGDTSTSSVNRFHRIITSGYRDSRYLDWLGRKYRVPKLLMLQKISPPEQHPICIDPLWVWSLLVSFSRNDSKGTLLSSRLHSLHPNSSAILFLSLALERFLAHLLSYAVYSARSQSSSSSTLIASQGQLSLALARSGKYIKCLTPLHIFKAIYAVKEFSFLREDLEPMD